MVAIIPTHTNRFLVKLKVGMLGRCARSGHMDAKNGEYGVCPLLSLWPPVWVVQVPSLPLLSTKIGKREIRASGSR